MKRSVSIYIITVFSMLSFVKAQTETIQLPYYEVPEYSEQYTAGTVAARMIDALGFRFYWASKDLTKENLAYRISEDVRPTRETIDHIYDLSKIIVNATLKLPNSRGRNNTMSYEDKRAKTLQNLKTAADILRGSDDISQFKIIFGERKIPIWNLINGPIADAMWHCGQIVSYRRASGNPINSKVDHFAGKVRS